MKDYGASTTEPGTLKRFNKKRDKGGGMTISGVSLDTNKVGSCRGFLLYLS